MTLVGVRIVVIGRYPASDAGDLRDGVEYFSPSYDVLIGPLY